MGRLTILFAKLHVVIVQPPLFLDRHVEVAKDDFGFKVAPRVVQHVPIVLASYWKYQ